MSISQVENSNIHLVEAIARTKKNNLKTQLFLSIGLISFEYLLHSIIFLFLFQYKVAQEFPDFVWNQPWNWFNTSYYVDDYLLLLLSIFIVYTVIMVNKGLFSLFKDSSLADDLFLIVKAVLISFLIAIGIIFFLKTSIIYSRVFVVIFSVSMVIVSCATRVLKRRIVSSLKRHSIITRKILIIGAGKVGIQLFNYLKQNSSNGAEVVGFLDDQKVGDNIIGRVNGLEQIVQQYRITEVIITIPSERTLINRVIAKIRKYDLEIKIIPEFFDIITSTVSFQESSEYPYMQILKTPLRGLNLFLKRMVDIFLSALGIFIISPVMIITALMIKLDSKGPIFFKQQRIGKNGVPFNMYKFRSMLVNAEELKKELEKFNEAEGPVFKIKNDPRITKIGKFIRKYSIDELPQLFNVLAGNMSLIGPRPPLPKEVEKYSDHQWRRLDISPGITGLWQVSGRSDLSFDEWVNLDVFYIENWSVKLDIQILLRTLPVVIHGRGAY